MKFKLKILFVFSLGSILMSSQEIALLKKEASAAPEKEKVNIYIEIGKIFYEKYSATDSLLLYSQKAFEIATAQNYSDGKNRALLSISQAYQRMSNYDTSSFILNKLLTVSDQNILGEVHSCLGVNYYRVNDNKSALDHYFKSVSAFSASKNKNSLPIVYTRMSIVFNNETQYKQAQDYVKKAIACLSEISEPYSKITVLANLAGIYIQLGISDKVSIDTSINYSRQALDLIRKYGYYTKANQLCNSISNAYYLKHDSLNALAYCKESLKFRKYLLPTEILVSYLNLSDSYNRLKQYNNCLIYLDSAKQIVPLTNDPYYQMRLYERVHAYNKDAGNLTEALMGLERFKTLQDSLYTLEKSTAINELEQKYNKVENEKKIVELNKENEISALNVKFLAVGILASVLVIIVIIFFYRQSVLKNKFKALETEQRLNRARMDPHFFFNALSSIQTLAMDNENNLKIPSLISKFSKIMRQSLESTYDELTTIEEEILFITNYLDIQKLRFNNKFDFEIKIDEKLEVDELKIPGMLLQPFIENAIEHGFKNVEYKGKLSINFVKEENGLKVELLDNGSGFNTDNIYKEYPSRATQIVSDRLMLLNKTQKSNAGYKLSQNPEGKGIMVEVDLPFIW